MGGMDDKSANPSRPRWQFAISSLLFVVLCIAGILAGFRAGYYSGTERRRMEDFSTKVYPVSDFTSPDEMILTITRNIEPESWQDLGGRGTVGYVPDNSGSLVVYQTGAVHDSIDRVLTDLRKRKATK